MLQFLSADDIFSEILLRRSADPRTILIVEGPTDLDALDPHLDEARCDIIAGNGSLSVSGAVSHANNQGVVRVLGLIDADFFGVSANVTGPPVNVFMTSFYDLDAELFNTPLLVDRLVSAFADRNRVVSALGAATFTGGARRMAVSLAAPLGYLRLASLEYGWSLALRDFPLAATIDRNPIHCNSSRLIAIAMSKSQSTTSISPARVAAGLAAIAANAPCASDRVCSGHDLASALAALIRLCGGSIGAEVVERNLRSACNCDVLRSFAFALAVSAWAATHRTRVFKCV